MKAIELPPYAPMLMESTRALGYSVEAAIADLVDNSISADSKKIDIQFRPYNPPYLVIIDDGNGMTPDELTSAMRYGSKNPIDMRNATDLGRFGLGLKTASLSQCKILTVASITNGVVSAKRWDLDFIKDGDGRWLLLELDSKEIEQLPMIEALKKQKKGTAVIWQNLDRLGVGETSFETAFGEKLEIVREHLSLVFHRYLTGERNLKKVQISINNLPVEPHNPFLNSMQTMDEESILVEKERVTVVPYLLPHVSKISAEEIKSLGGQDGLRRNQGFYVYRNKRLLVWGTWFRLMRQDDLSKLARVQVDIPNTLDHLWTLDIRKSSAIPPEIVRKNLSRIIEKIIEPSRRTWKIRSKKEVSDSLVHVWSRFKLRTGIMYCINRDYPLVESLKQNLQNGSHRLLEKVLTLIEQNIPLNHLYLDLTHDEKFATDEIEEQELRTRLKECLELLLNSCKDKDAQQELIKKIKFIEPFSSHKEILVELLDEVAHGRNAI